MCGMQEGGVPVAYVPNVLYSELSRLTVLPDPLPADPEAHLLLQTAATRAAADAAALSPTPLKPAALTQLQDSLASQLDGKLPHSPAQLAEASGLFAAVTAHTPATALPRTSALVLSNARGAVAAPRGGQSAVEVLRTCGHCSERLCAHAQVAPPPPPIPAAACTTLTVDGATQKLVATGATPTPEESDATIKALQQSGAVTTCAFAPCLQDASRLKLHPSSFVFMPFFHRSH